MVSRRKEWALAQVLMYSEGICRYSGKRQNGGNNIKLRVTREETQVILQHDEHLYGHLGKRNTEEGNVRTGYVGRGAMSSQPLCFKWGRNVFIHES
jgi:hypothetical protein